MPRLLSQTIRSSSMRPFCGSMTWSSLSRYSPLSFFRGQHEGDRVPPVPVEVVLEVELDRRVGGEVLELGERPDREHVMVGHHEVLRHQEARGDRALAFPAVEVADQADGPALKITGEEVVDRQEVTRPDVALERVGDVLGCDGGDHALPPLDLRLTVEGERPLRGDPRPDLVDLGGGGRVGSGLFEEIERQLHVCPLEWITSTPPEQYTGCRLTWACVRGVPSISNVAQPFRAARME